MQKKKFSTELAWLIGIIVLALGVVFMERADFGMSMVVAPAYILYLKLSEVFPFVTFGMMEYVLQAILLLGMTVILRKWRFVWLFSFVTAVLYGLILDGERWLLLDVLSDALWCRALWFVCGLVCCSVAISLLFQAYFMPEVYELLVKVLAEERKAPVSRVKTIYDCISCAVSVVLSFCFFGLWQFRGVNWGTVVCALVNGILIGGITKLLERRFVFVDALPLRGFFAGRAERV